MFSPYILCLTLLTDILLVEESALKTRWTIQEQRHNVELYSEVQLNTESIWQQLDDVTKELDEQLEVRSSGKPIQVMLFRDHKSYLNYLASKIPQARRRKAIYYRNGDVSQIYAYQSRSLLTDLRHEMTHALLHQHLPFIPLWLDEGLAEYFEEERNARTSSSRIATTQWKARVGISPSLVLLESVPSAEDMDADTYRESWAWVSYLLNDSSKSADVLRSYVAAIHGGEAPGAFSSFAGAEMVDFQKQANSYFRKMTIRVASRSSSER